MSKIMHPRFLSHGIGILAVAGLAGCGLGGRAHGPASPNASAVVDMGFSSFQPETVHIRAGQTVEWRNTSVITHSVTDDRRAASKPQDASIPVGSHPLQFRRHSRRRSLRRPLPGAWHLQVLLHAP